MTSNSELPLGTVVKIKNNNNLLVIIGYNDIIKNKLQGYYSVVYPIGTTTGEDFIEFNDQEVNKIVFLGYKDEKYDNFVQAINNQELMNQLIEKAMGEENNEWKIWWFKWKAGKRWEWGLTFDTRRNKESK